jgi:hypothetical protein
MHSPLRYLYAVLCLVALPAAADPAPGTAAILPVVGSTGGAHGSNFKTQLQMSNRTLDVANGWLRYRPAAKAAEVTQIRFELGAHATVAWDDVVAAFERTGLGSMDVVLETGEVPVIVARAYDDQESGTTGATIEPRRPEEALQRGERATLIVPPNREAFRYNIGVRTLETATVLRLTVRNQAGIERHVVQLAFEPQWFEQRAADQLTGTVLLPNESISIEVVSGSAIVYGTTVDNRTNDSSIQTLERPRLTPVP